MSATTIYDVVTRYRTETGAATVGTRRYGEEAMRTGSALGLAQTKATALFGTLARFAGVAGGIAGVGYAIHRSLTATFTNLNAEMNSSLALAAQVNLAFRFDADPAANFVASMKVSKDLMAGLSRDAARLPGQLSDFVGIAQIISGSVFSGGGKPEQVRSLTAKVALAAPSAGQSAADAGQQAMRILFGTASVGDNPLFRNMLGGQLFGPGMTTEKFNALPAAERLQRFDEALSKLTDNPIFRSSIIRTFDTQLGTLADNLFGINGIVTQAGGRELFDSLLGQLTDLNTSLETKMPSIVGNLSMFRAEIGRWADLIGSAGSFAMHGPSGNRTWNFFEGAASGVVAELGSQTAGAIGGAYTELLATLNVHRQKGGVGTIADLQAEVRRLELLRYYESGQGKAPAARRNSPLSGGADSKPEATNKPAVPAAPVVHQTNYIQVDLHSDDSPEAIAVKIGKAMEIAERHPKRSARAIAMMPTASVARGTP